MKAEDIQLYLFDIFAGDFFYQIYITFNQYGSVLYYVVYNKY